MPELVRMVNSSPVVGTKPFVSITLNGPDNRWYVTGYVKNAMDNANITGEYLTSSTSGLYTNAFLGDPRTYGVTVGVHL